MIVPVASSQHLLRSTHRVLSYTRLALAAHAVVFNALRMDAVARPELLVVASIVLLLWSLALTQFVRLPQRWHRPVRVADVALTLMLVASSRWVVGFEGANTYPPATVFWQVAAPLAVAVSWGSWAGLVSGLVIGLGSIVQTPWQEPDLWSTVFSLALAGWGLGKVVDQLRRTTAERDRSLAATMALGERDRMNRIVHDGVLQVLALVEREGRSMGPKGQQLARLARGQEIQLRSLLQDRTVAVDTDDQEEPNIDIAAMLDALSSERVTVSVMAGTVLMPRAQAAELQAAVAQILLNVELHAGADAEVWMLLEEDDDGIIVSVRDNGVGMTREQVQNAFDIGRLGIKESIIGRVRDLGGTAEVQSSPGRGVEWELRIPIGDAHGDQP